MTVFLSNWGGESFYWAESESPELKETIALLTDRSMPTSVKLAVRAGSLNTYTRLWAVSSVSSTAGRHLGTSLGGGLGSASSCSRTPQPIVGRLAGLGDWDAP
jgi:hypothetical protein